MLSIIKKIAMITTIFSFIFIFSTVIIFGAGVQYHCIINLNCPPGPDCYSYIQCSVMDCNINGVCKPILGSTCAEKAVECYCADPPSSGGGNCLGEEMMQ